MLVLGVDGGGTKTLAVVADPSGRVVGFATGPETNPLDQPRWREHLRQTVAAAMADIEPDRLAAAAFGLPVHGEVAAISAEQLALAGELFAGASVRNDVHTAHEAAFCGGPGVLLLAGTGSMCWAADAAGRTVRVGGWGDGFGDEGSAHAIGHAALRRVSQILDGRHSGAPFAEAILAAVGTTRAAQPDGLLNWFYGNPSRRPAVAALAVVVDGLGDDEAAASILRDAADALALHVAAAREALCLASPGPWCFVGGVARSATIGRALAVRLGSQPLPPRLPPVGGAVWRAARDAGWDTDETWIGRLSAGLTQRLETT